MVLNLLWFVGPLLETLNTSGSQLSNKIFCLYFIRSIQPSAGRKWLINVNKPYAREPPD